MQVKPVGMASSEKSLTSLPCYLLLKDIYNSFYQDFVFSTHSHLWLAIVVSQSKTRAVLELRKKWFYFALLGTLEKGKQFKGLHILY